MKSYGLKAQKLIAQGNALGFYVIAIKRPERAKALYPYYIISFHTSSSSSLEVVSRLVSCSMVMFPLRSIFTSSGMYSSVLGCDTLAANLSTLPSFLSNTSPSSIPVLR